MASRFKPTLVPDGQKSHWLRVNRKLSEAAGVKAGEIVTLEITPAAKETELQKCRRDCEGPLAAAAPKARAFVVGHYAQRTQRLDPLASPFSCQAAGDALRGGESKMRARCSRVGNAAFAASTDQGSTVKA